MLPIVGTEGSTVVNGSIYKALEGLDKLSAEIKNMAGVERTGLFSWLGEWFDRYTTLVVAGFLTLVAVLVVLMCCGACITPCLRKSITDVVHATGKMPLLKVKDNEADTEMGLMEDDPWFATGEVNE